MIYIAVPNMNDSVSDVTIDDVQYRLRFTYNETYDYWSFGVRTANNEPIVEE